MRSQRYDTESTRASHTLFNEIYPSYILDLKNCLDKLDQNQIWSAARLLYEKYRSKAKIFFAGNGGSACTASHIATDLAKTVLDGGKLGFRTFSLTQNIGLVTAWANDKNYQCVFSEQLYNLADVDDLLVVISCSGESQNIVSAIKTARNLRMQTIGLLGASGAETAKNLDIAIMIPSTQFALIEDVHLIVGHLLTIYFQKMLKSSN